MGLIKPARVRIPAIALFGSKTGRSLMAGQTDVNEESAGLTKAKMPVEIRPLQSADQADWRGLWTDYLEFYGTSVSEAVIATTFARLIGTDPQDFSCLVAVYDGKLVGLTHYLFHRNNWKIENTCYLQDLFVAKAARGTGAGRALIEGVYAASRAANVQAVHWMTQEDNTTARQLYDRIAQKSEFVQYVKVTP